MGRVKAGGRLEEAWREGASSGVTAFGLLQCKIVLLGVVAATQALSHPVLLSEGGEAD